MSEPGSPPHVLVVDDSEVDQMLLSAMIARLGATCEQVWDGAQAVAAARAAAYDVVLIDIGLPVLDGLSAARIIVADPATGAPVVAPMSSAPTDDERRLAAEIGTRPILQKPLSLETLQRTLRMGAAAAAVDESVLEDLVDQLGDRHLVADVVSTFEREATSRRRLMVAALEAGNLTEVVRLSHSLKSAAAMVGAQGTSGLAADLERAARAVDASTDVAAELGPRLARVVESLEPAVEALAAWRGSGGSPLR